MKTRNVVVRPDDISAFAGLPPGNYVSLAVTDTGMGIRAAIVGRVTDPRSSCC